MDSNTPTLASLAEIALDVIAEFYDDEEFNDIEQLCDVDKLRLQYKRSDCDNFAFAMNLLTGWDMVSVTSSKGALHRLVRTPPEDGARLVDVEGFVSEADLRKRYKSKTLSIATTSTLMGCTVDSDDDALSLVVAAMAYLPTAPFTDAEFSGKVQAWLAGYEAQTAPADALRLKI